MLTRGHVEALAKSITDPKASFDAALATGDIDAATAVALAAVITDRPMGLADLQRIAADVSVADVLLPLFARAVGPLESVWSTLDLDEHRSALVLAAAVSRLSSPEVPDDSDAAKPAEVPNESDAPKWLVTALAEQINRSLGDAAYELLVACVHQLDAPELFKVRHSVKTYLTPADAREVWATVKRDIAKPLQLLPETELSLPVLSVKHGADEPGRNDPCPCGSGQKYKKCHGAAGGLDPVPTRSRAERLSALLPRLEPKHVRALTATDLLRADWSTAPTPLVLAAFRELMFRQRWTHAEALLELLCAREPDKADGSRDEFIWQALLNGRRAEATRQFARVAKPDALTPVIDIHAALLDTWPPWLALIEDVCATAAITGEQLDLLDLTYVLLQRAPGLGLWLATGVYGRVGANEASTLYGAMDDARDRLGLPAISKDHVRQRVRSGEPEKGKAAKPAPDAKEKAKIRALESTLEESKRKMRQIEQQLEKEKSRAQAEPAVPPPPPGARKAFAQRIDDLEDRIREGNAERARLRKEVAELTERLQSDKASAAPAKPAEGVPDDSYDSAVRPRGLMLAQWEPRAVESLEALPARVQEDVLVKIAELGSGDAAHWIEVKALQGVAGLYSARIGIHYRALFTIEGKALRVHEVVHREGFDTALRRFK